MWPHIIKATQFNADALDMQHLRDVFSSLNPAGTLRYKSWSLVFVYSADLLQKEAELVSIAPSLGKEAELQMRSRRSGRPLISQEFVPWAPLY